MKPILLAVSILMVLTGSACSPPSSSSNDASGGEDDSTTVLVRTVQPKKGSLSARLEVSARIEAFERADIFPRLQGVVTAIHRVEGDSVKQGQVLAEIESEEYQIAREAQELAVNKARRAVKQARFALDEVKAQKEGQDSNHEREERRLKRARQQRQADVITDEQLEEIRSAFDLAQAEVKRLKINIERLTHEVEVAGVSLKEAESALKSAQLKCEWATIRATLDGQITSRNLHLGQQATMTAAAYSIADFSSLIIHAGIPQKSLRHIATGLAVELTSTAWPTDVFKGVVEFVAPEVDITTGTVACRIALPQAEGMGKLRPGLFVSGHVVTETRNDILLLPRRAVLFDRDRLYVYVISSKNGDVRTAHKVYLERGLENSESIQCLPAANSTLELTEDTQVVLVGMDRLLDGSVVELEDEPLAGSEQSSKDSNKE